MEVSFGDQGLLCHTDEFELSSVDRCADGFGLPSVDRRELSEVFKQGRDLLRFASREVMLAAMQKECKSRKREETAVTSQAVDIKSQLRPWSWGGEEGAHKRCEREMG